MPHCIFAKYFQVIQEIPLKQNKKNTWRAKIVGSFKNSFKTICKEKHLHLWLRANTTFASEQSRGKAQHQLHELLLFSYPSSFSRGDGAVLQAEPSFWFREWNRRKQNWAGWCLKGTSVTQNTSLRFFSPYSPCCSRFSQNETDHGYDKRTLCIPNWITGDPKLTFVHTAVTYLEINSTEPFLCHHLFQHRLDLSFISYLVNLERQIQNKKNQGTKVIYNLICVLSSF